MAAASLNLTNGAQLGHLPPSARSLPPSARSTSEDADLGSCATASLVGVGGGGAGGATRTRPCDERDDGGRAGAAPSAGLRARGGGPRRGGQREG